MDLRYLENGGIWLKSKIKHKLLGYIGPGFSSVQKLPDQKFLELFNIECIGKRISKDDVSSSLSCLIEYYGKKVKSGWLAPPKAITDLRLNLDQIGHEELNDQADSILQFKFMPSNHSPRFTKDDDIDWHFNPISSREWILRLHRHQWWPVLGLAYLNTGDERYAIAFVKQMTDWILKNPLPRQKDERNHAWRLMEVGLRLRVSWIPSFGLFFESPFFDNKAKLKMLRSIYDHARFLYFYKTNRNHLLRESNGLAHASAYFSEFKEARLWQEKALSRIDKEIARQINSDGSHIEVSTGYQWLVVDELEKTYDLLSAYNLFLPKEDLKTSLEKMYNVLSNLIRPDGTFPEINDGFVRWDYSRLEDAGKRFGRKDFIYVGTAGKEGVEPTTNSIGLKDAGFFIMRSDWTKDARYLLFDAGPYGGPHGHEDKLSIEVFAYGKPFIVDSGSYTYDKKDPYRNYFVGSQAHNTVLINGKSQIRRWKKENLKPVTMSENQAVWISHEGFDYAEASYSDGYSEFSLQKPGNPKIINDVIHTRKILFVKPDYWIVIDSLNAAENHDYEILFHASPDIKVNINNDSIVEFLAHQDDVRLYLMPEDSLSFKIRVIKGCEAPIQGWYSVDHHKKVPSSVVVFSTEGVQNIESAILLYPFSAGSNRDMVSFKKLKVSKGRCSAFAVNFSHGIDYLMLSNNYEPKKFGPFQAKGIIAIVRTDENGRILNRYEEI